MKTAYVSEDPEQALADVVRVLNEGFSDKREVFKEAHSNLMRLVEEFQAAGGPTNTDPYPTLLRMVFPRGCPSLHNMGKRCQVTIAPAGSGAYYSINYVGELGKPLSSWDLAALQFIRLITSNFAVGGKFAGPCARCGKYYIKKKQSQKVYCSRTCGNQATALKRTKEKWDEARKQRLDQAKKAARHYRRAETDEQFQSWAVKRYAGLTKRFLTRALNNHEIPEPTRIRSQRVTK